MATSVDVACFGEVLWDFFRESRERGKAGDSFRREIGGAPANVAVVLARLGVRASVVGAVGADAFGDALRDALADEGVIVDHLGRRSERTGLTFVEHDARGEPSFLFYRHESADMSVDAKDVASTAARATFGLVGSSTSVTERLAAATEAFVTHLEKSKGALVLDLNVRPHLWPSEASMKTAVAALAGRAALIKASESDLELLAGKRGMSWLERHAPSATWILTRGENGAAAVGPHGQITAPTRRVRCVDATGAGDAFLAGALAVLLAARATPGTPAWADEKVWARALEVGHQLGAKAVSAPGAVSAVLGLDDVRARLAASTVAAPPSGRKAPSRKRSS